MEQMGKVLWRLVAMVAGTKNNHNPIAFAKWDIKDGFWHLVVLEEDAWHFCYVLPRVNEDDPIEIVKPPPLFCAASETARDIVQENLYAEDSLAPHPLEQLCLPEDLQLPPLEWVDNKKMATILEVYMDEFIGLAHSMSKDELVHFMRADCTEFIPSSHHRDQRMTSRTNLFQSKR